jgi:hypothetical protein
MVLIDWNKICERITDELGQRLHFDTDEKYKPFRKFYHWWGTKATPFIMNIASFFVLYGIFSTIYSKFGLDRLIVIFITIFVLNLRWST